MEQPQRLTRAAKKAQNARIHKSRTREVKSRLSSLLSFDNPPVIRRLPLIDDTPYSLVPILHGGDALKLGAVNALESGFAHKLAAAQKVRSLHKKSRSCRQFIADSSPFALLGGVNGYTARKFVTCYICFSVQDGGGHRG